MPSPHHNLISVILWSGLAMLVGVSLSAGIFSTVEMLSTDALANARRFVLIASKKVAVKDISEKAPETTTAAKNIPVVSIPLQGKAVRVDLENRSLALYENGQFLKNFLAVAVPDKFSPWRVPQGAYIVKAREAEHYSPLAEASFPKAILFGDNGLIRAEGGGSGGQSAAAGVSVEEQAGIILKSEDAAELFGFADTATEIIVLNEIPENRAVNYDEVLREESAASPRASQRISARAALAADLDTGEIFFEKLPDLVLPIASVSKLFTAVVAEEMLPPEKIVSISPRALATYGGSGELRSGDEFSVQELLYPLLIESSNDAAEALAETVGREQFIAAMNALAKKLGLVRTSFKDPSGLLFGNTSTARDLFLFSQFLVSAGGGSSSGGKNHADILAISKTPAFEASANDFRTGARRWRNNNEFVRDGNPYLIGTKNGYTDEAAQTTVSLFALPVSETKVRRVAVVLLGSHNREGDVLTLLKESGKETLYKKTGFSDVFRKKAEKYLKEKEKESPEFRLAVFGMPRAADMPQDVSRIFDDVLYLKPYDALFTNVDGVIADTGYNIAGDTAIRMPQEILPTLATLGVDVINVANAHAGDWGRSAFGDNMKILEEKGFLVVGGSEDASGKGKPAVIEQGGVTVGFLSFSDEGPEWLAKDEYLPSLLSAKDPLFPAHVSDAARTVDHLVVGISFGGRESTFSQERKVELAHHAIDAGARVVVGFFPSGNPRKETYRNGIIFYGQAPVIPEEVVLNKNAIVPL
ncbi:MAG: CapA family protein [Parcubacteria group bacterium]|nr:CapA family protein [Parcubacteria group bacterium]